MKTLIVGIFKLILPYILLVFPQLIIAEWHWGREGAPFNCSQWSEPEGFIGCDWFNNGLGWAKDNPITFSNWNNRKVIVSPLCFTGALATVCKYWSWPVVSKYNGYLNLGDTNGNMYAIQNSRLVALNHTWKYNEFRTGDCFTDDPSSRIISNCSTPGECLASDEITRLYDAILVACNGNYNNYQNWGSSIKHLDHILKTRLGFSNVGKISGDDPYIHDTLYKYLYMQATQSPVICATGAHTYILDGYKTEGHKVHKLDWGGCDFHPSFWVDIDQTASYIFNTKPDFKIASGNQYELTYLFGNDYIPNTSGTYRNSSLYIKSNITGSTIRYSLNIRAYYWNGSQWGNPVDLLNSYYQTNSTTGAFETGSFSFHVPADGSLKLVCAMSHNSSTTISNRSMLHDFQDEDRIEYRCNNALKTAIIEGGNIEVEGGESVQPEISTGLHFNYLGSARCGIGADGILYRNERSEMDGTWLDNPTNILNCLVFRTRDGVITHCIGNDGKIKIRRQVQSPFKKAIPKAVIITGPISSSFYVGTPMHITWEYADGDPSSHTVCLNVIWENMLYSTSIPSTSLRTNYYDWTVPETIRYLNQTFSLCNKDIWLEVKQYNGHWNDITETPIRIRCQ